MKTLHTIETDRTRIQQSISIQWNSILLEMESILDLKPALQTICCTHAILCISDTEWKIVTIFVELLLPFENFTNAVGYVKYPTYSSVLPRYRCLLKHLNTFSDKYQRTSFLQHIESYFSILRMTTKQKFDSCGDIATLATILDP